MFSLKNNTLRKGFTLIELLIVILIISLVYFIGFSDIEVDKSEPKALTPLNLKSNILTSKGRGKHLTLLCVNECKTCLLRRDINAPYEDYTGGIDLSNIKAYTLDARDALVPIEYERYDDEKICLKMDFYPNGSSTQLIVQNDTGTYFLPTYFEEPKQFESPEDAKEYWLNNAQLVSDEGAFY